MCTFSFKMNISFFCKLMEIKGINFMKKHWISTFDTFRWKNKIVAHGLLFGCIPQLLAHGLLFWWATKRGNPVLLKNITDQCSSIGQLLKGRFLARYNTLKSRPRFSSKLMCQWSKYKYRTPPNYGTPSNYSTPLFLGLWNMLCHELVFIFFTERS